MDDTGAPKLDRRSHDDVIAQTEALLTAYTAAVPGGPWRPRSDGTLDFGGTLVRLFGGMLDHLITQLNQVPDKHRLAFTGLVGARRLSPQPARAPVTFTLASGTATAQIPAGAQIAATGSAGPAVFETELPLSLTRTRLAAAVVREAADAGGYANQTDIATGRAPGTFAALGGGQPIEHSLYIAADSLLALPGVQTLTVVLDGGASPMPAVPVTWSAALATGGWAPLPAVTVAGSSWTLAASASAINPILVNGVKARWLRAMVPAATPRVVITTGATFNVTSKQQVDPSAPAAAPVPLDAACSNGQPLDLSRDILPFGDRPKFNDVFYLASDAAFAVAGTRVTLAFTLTLPPDDVNASSDLKLQWEAWDGQTATVLGTTTRAGADPGSGLTDATKAFTVSDAVTFTLPAAIARAKIGAVTSRWVRVRIVAGNYGTDISVTIDNTVNPPKITIIPASFRPPSISSVALTWSGTAAAQPPSAAIRQTALTYTYLPAATTGATAVPVFLAAPELEFQQASETRSSLQLGFDRAFEPVLTTLYFQVAAPPSPDPLSFGGSPAPRNPPSLAWEYWNGNAWAAITVEDDTQGLSRSGLVRFVPASDARQLVQFGRKLYWLRARAVDLAFSPMPQVGRVLLNTVWASNAHTTTLEVLGSASGARSQQLTLARTPVLDGQHIEVGEPAPPPAAELAALQAVEGSDVLTPDPTTALTWVRWHEVPDFWASGPRDRHYTLDAATGAVTFGDGSAGLIPPTGLQNVRAAHYRSGGGPSGNVTSGAIAHLKTTIANVQSVTNLAPATGGASIEPAAAMLARAARTLRHGGRAVTAEDFADLALASSRAVARSATLTPAFSPISQGSGPRTGPGDLQRDGQVIIVIVPAATRPGMAPSVDLCAQVEDYLRARCAPDAQVTVTGPTWAATDIAIHVAAASLERSDAVLAAAREAIAALLDPLTGGEGSGWDFGRRPRESDLVALVAGLSDVDHVSSVTITCDPPFTADDTQTPPSATALSLFNSVLFYARSITVTASSVQPEVVP